VTPRAAALAIWEAALAASAAGPLVARAVERRGDRLEAGALRVDLARVDDVLVLGCGKASAAMARALDDGLGDRIARGFVVVKDGYGAAVKGIEIVEAGHPVPDARGQAAARRLLELARGAGPRDLIVFLVSGGGSALTPAPVAPITLEEKQAVTRLLLEAGATIGELNAVRKHVSFLKGGQLARAAAPATLLTLALSDVIGDPLDVIASGPTAPDPTTFAEALAVLTDRGISGRVPPSILRRLQAGARGEVAETPKPGDPVFDRVTNHVIGNNAIVVAAAAAAAERAGYRAVVLTRELQGEAREVGPDLVRRARALPAPACLLAAGETTVTVRGRGRGGRCQELALAAAIEMAGDPSLTLLAAGTDGTDGPTDAAGAVVDAGTVRRGAASGRDPRIALGDNDSHAFLRASGDLVVTGPTGTNLLDLCIALRSGADRIGEAV
jgi:glycerate 2-kinase